MSDIEAFNLGYNIAMGVGIALVFGFLGFAIVVGRKP